MHQYEVSLGSSYVSINHEFLTNFISFSAPVFLNLICDLLSESMDPVSAQVSNFLAVTTLRSNIYACVAGEIVLKKKKGASNSTTMSSAICSTETESLLEKRQ